MRYLPFKHWVAGMAFAGFVGVSALAQTHPWSNVGTTPTQEELQAERGTGPSGKDLPPGRGTAKDGARTFLLKCSMCHGQNAEGVTQAPGSGSILRGARLTGGKGVVLWGPNGPNPGVSKLFYTAYVTTLWNAIAMSMPFFKPGSLTSDEVYSVVAYILFKNDFIKEDQIMDRETLPKVELPQQKNHIPANLEEIPDIQKRGCFKTYGVCP